MFDDAFPGLIQVLYKMINFMVFVQRLQHRYRVLTFHAGLFDMINSFPMPHESKTI